MARSATLSREIERIGELNGIVYIKDAYYVEPRTGRVLSGALSHEVTMAGSHRVLHVTVAPESGDRCLITLAHELQHAIEVLEAKGAVTRVAVDRLFERIGMQVGARSWRPSLQGTWSGSWRANSRRVARDPGTIRAQRPDSAKLDPRGEVAERLKAAVC